MKMTFYIFLSPPVLMHGGLLAVALSVRLGLDQNSLEKKSWTRKKFITRESFTFYLQAIASHLPVTLIKVYGIGRWPHINVKLHFY